MTVLEFKDIITNLDENECIFFKYGDQKFIFERIDEPNEDRVITIELCTKAVGDEVDLMPIWEDTFTNKNDLAVKVEESFDEPVFVDKSINEIIDEITILDPDEFFDEE